MGYTTHFKSLGKPGHHTNGAPTFSRPQRSFWSAVASFVASVAPKAVDFASKQIPWLTGGKTAAANTDTNTNIDYGSMLEGGAKGIDAVSRAIKGDPESSDVTIKKLDQQLDREKHEMAKKQMEFELNRSYSETSITDRWIDDKHGFSKIDQNKFEWSVTLKDATRLLDVSCLIDDQMTMRGFESADVEAVKQALEIIQKGEVVDSFINLQNNNFNDGNFCVRAGGLQVETYDSYVLESRQFQRGDRVVWQEFEGEVCGVVKRVGSKGDVVVGPVSGFTGSSALSDLVARGRALKQASRERILKMEDIHDEATGSNYPPPSVKTATRYAVRIHLGRVKGSLSKPMLRHKIRKVSKEGNKETIEEYETKEVLPSILKPDELIFFEQVALGRIGRGKEIQSEQNLDDCKHIDK